LHKFPIRLIALMYTYSYTSVPFIHTFLRRFLRLAVWADVNSQHCEGSPFLFSTTVISRLCLSTDRLTLTQITHQYS